MIDRTEGKLDEALKFAKDINDNSLENCIARLKLVDSNTGSETTLYEDFSPKSFYFVRYKESEFVGNGGIIFHGKHDGYGSGNAPTFSVSLTPVNGWQIHT